VIKKHLGVHEEEKRVLVHVKNESRGNGDKKGESLYEVHFLYSLHLNSENLRNISTDFSK
jgi:hypothetical protein